MSYNMFNKVGHVLLDKFSKDHQVHWRADTLVVGGGTDFERRNRIEKFLRKSSSKLDHSHVGFMFLADLVVENSATGNIHRKLFVKILSKYASFVKREHLIDAMHMNPIFAEEVKTKVAEITFRKE